MVEPSIEFVEITDTSVTWRVINLDPSYAAWGDMYVIWNGTQLPFTYSLEPGITETPMWTDTLTGGLLISGTVNTLELHIYYNGIWTYFIQGEVTLGTATQRPSYFSWNTAKIAGEPFNLTYLEWVALIVNIDKVRAYKGLNGYPYDGVMGQGEPFTAQMYNDVVNAIIVIPGYIYQNFPLETVSSGDPVTAKCLNDLVAAINSIS